METPGVLNGYELTTTRNETLQFGNRLCTACGKVNDIMILLLGIVTTWDSDGGDGIRCR